MTPENLPEPSAPSPEPAGPPGPPPTSGDGAEALIAQLSADRLWLLRQIDAGRWPELRLDLAALERELGQMLDLAAERLAPR